MITIEDFAKVELKTGKILEAEQVKDSQKLLKLQVDLGSEKRQILAGIAQHYEPSELIGKEVVIVANLTPRTIMGEESQGMVLAAGLESVILLTTDKEVPPGAIIR